MKESMISVLLVEPCKRPKVIKIENTLEKLQELVGGYIEVFYPFEDKVAVIANEEGKINGLPLNRALYCDSKIYDIIAGTFLVVGLGEEDFISLSSELSTKFFNRFWHAETFVELNGNILSVPCKPKES